MLKYIHRKERIYKNNMQEHARIYTGIYKQEYTQEYTSRNIQEYTSRNIQEYARNIQEYALIFHTHGEWLKNFILSCTH